MSGSSASAANSRTGGSWPDSPPRSRVAGSSRVASRYSSDSTRVASTLDVDIGLLGERESAEVEAALRRAVALDLGDRFAFELGQPRRSGDDHALTVPITAYIGAQRFEQFRVDLAPPRGDTPTEFADFTFVALGIPQLDEHPAIPVIALSQQIAEKVCAILERRGDAFSSRARDLADVASIALQVDGIDGTAVIEALNREAERRPQTVVHGLPTTFMLDARQAEEWRRRWRALIRQSPIDFERALHTTTLFLDPVLDRRARGRVWSSVSLAWERRRNDEMKGPHEAGSRGS